MTLDSPYSFKYLFSSVKKVEIESLPRTYKYLQNPFWFSYLRQIMTVEVVVENYKCPVSGSKIKI